MSKDVYKEKSDERNHKKKINCCFNKEQWQESIKQKFFCSYLRTSVFLRPRILGRSLIYVIAVNTPGLLFFIFQFQFDNDEMTGVCIKCNCCKKNSYLPIFRNSDNRYPSSFHQSCWVS